MKTISDLILERNHIDNQLVINADASLRNNTISPTEASRLDGAESALSYILGRFHITADSAHNCTSLSEMLDYILDPLCIMYEPRDLRETDWRHQTVHMLGFLADGSAIALIPSVGGYRYVCPATGEAGWVTKKTALEDTAYVIYRPLPEGKYSLYSFALLTFSMISPGDYVPIIAAIGAITLLGLVSPALNRQVLDRLVPLGTAAYPQLMTAALVFLSTGLLRTVIIAVKKLLLSSVELRISTQVQAAVVSRILFLPDSFFKDNSAGKISKRISNSQTLANQLVGMVMDTSITTVFSLVYIPQMASYAPTLYIPALLILAAQFILSVFASAVYAKNMMASNEVSMEESSFVFSAMRGIQKLKTSGALKRAYAKWAELYRRLLVYTLDPPHLVKLRGVLITFISSFGTVLIVSLAVPAGITQADYIAFNASYGLIITAMIELMDVVDSLFTVKPLISNLQPIFEAEPEQTHALEYIKKLGGGIQIEHVSFAYEESNRECLKDISLNIRRGEKVAIVGESGCGKSTLLRIIMGMETPSAGVVYYDGKPLPSLNKRSLRRKIGSVFQFSRVMPGSIRANIAFNAPDITEEEIWEAAERAQIGDLIRSLPLGLDTEISESSSGGFSGGQKQCILLARAFAGKPSMMILDEATSALDNVTQKKVLDSILAVRTTVIMVAHRLSTVKDCNRIIMLENGSISEQGTYDELMALNGSFAQLVRKQIKE